MSTPWNKLPTNNNNSEKKNGLPMRGGLLSAHAKQAYSGHQVSQKDQPDQAGQPYHLSGSQSLSPQAGASVQPSTGGPPGQSLSTNSSQVAQTQGMLSNTVNMVRRWSDKMATVAGYTPQAPAPYMERYHSLGQSGALQGTQRASYRRWRRSRVQRVTTQIRQRRLRGEQSSPKGKKIWLSVFLSFVALFVIVGAVGGFYGYDYYQGQLPRVQALAHNTIPQTTRFYDRQGQLLGVVQTDHPSTPVTYNDLPKVMQNAMIAAEDPTFWDNNGVDPQGILRALTQYLSAGGAVQSGGSTITQQVIKNLSKQDQTDLNRKVQEAAGAV